MFSPNFSRILNIILIFSRSPQYQSFGIGTTMAAYVGQTKDTLRAKTSTKNSNFPNGINGDTEVRFINSTIYILQGFINCLLLLFWITQPTTLRTRIVVYIRLLFLPKKFCQLYVIRALYVYQILKFKKE